MTMRELKTERLETTMTFWRVIGLAGLLVSGIVLGAGCYSTADDGGSSPVVEGPDAGGSGGDGGGSLADSGGDIGGTSGGGTSGGGTADGGTSGGGTGGSGGQTECPSGYRAEQGKCVDIDECAEGSDDCAEGQQCMNTEGSYSCSGGPTIERASASPGKLVPGETLTVEAVASDPDGPQDIAGGKLVDPDTGGVYGRFALGSGQGGYTVEVSWSKIESVRSISTPAGGADRTFRVQFQDYEGQVGQKAISVELGCPSPSEGVCSGSCYDFSANRDHCGGCGQKVPEAQECVGGQPRCTGGKTRCTNDDGEVVCVSLQDSPGFCGSCNNDCRDWAQRQPGVQRSARSYCHRGQCAVEVNSETPESCDQVCSGVGLSCTGDVPVYCGESNTTPSSCAFYTHDVYSEYTYEKLSCSQTPPTESTASGYTVGFEDIDCACE